MFSSLRQPKDFYQRLYYLALPVVLQNLITTSLGFMDTFMVGRLGNMEMAAVTGANVPIFILQLVMFGFQSGMSVLISQYWGKKDVGSINRVLGIALYAVTALTGTVALLMFFRPLFVLRLIMHDEQLVLLARPYLQLVGISYVFDGVCSVYSGMQRSTENPVFGMRVFAVAMGCNTFGNYILIFGKLGAPQLGITGAAVATLASRVIEFIITVVYALRSRRIPLLPAAILRPGKAMLRSFLRYSTPVVCNETLWSLGTSMLTVVMGHMENSVDMLAAYAVMGNIDKFSTVICFGVASATAVIIGKEIGEGRSREQVGSSASALLAVSLLVGLGTGILLLALQRVFFIPVLFPFFKLYGSAAQIAEYMCLIFAFSMPLRAFDVTNITGVLRAGGDVTVAICIDLLPLWLAAVPLSALFGLVLHTPPVWVCLAMQAENLFKLPVGLLRLRGGKWIHDITVT